MSVKYFFVPSAVLSIISSAAIFSNISATSNLNSSLLLKGKSDVLSTVASSEVDKAEAQAKAKEEADKAEVARKAKVAMLLAMETPEETEEERQAYRERAWKRWEAHNWWRGSSAPAYTF